MGHYRQLYRTESRLYLEHLLRLDAESRYARFCGVMNDQAIRVYWDRIDWRRITLLGFFCDGKLRAVAEIRYGPELFPDAAELAFSVERAFQNNGVGTTLIRRALVLLGNRGIHTADIVCLPENRRMRRLAQKHGSRSHTMQGEVTMTIAVPQSDAISLVGEMLDGYLGWLISAWEYGSRWPHRDDPVAA